MTISYNWISEYIPVLVPPEKISQILTSIGLEVEAMERYESVKGGLKGLVVGEVKECFPHPSADKLRLTRVDTGTGELLQIVCGAPNVATGQKVIVAPVGVTIFPLKGEPITMKKARIRGEESVGMICAEDEVGIGESHEGIVVLPQELPAGSAVSDFIQPYTDYIYEIGLTPNRMDAMSHMGVARDVCAWLRHHQGGDIKAKNNPVATAPVRNSGTLFSVRIENQQACKRYAGVVIKNVTVGESPEWLRNKLRAIGQRPINNIVDITNYILHDTGQPLHAFDAERVAGQSIIVKNLPEGTPFITLDGKERKLSSEDLMICDGNGKPMCIAGVFGGSESGVTSGTKSVFLESAWFNPIDVRKTSFRHGLRTDAATRFEKNVDISNTVTVLQRAAALICDITGGSIDSEISDEFPVQEERTQVSFSYNYIRKISGKNYDPAAVRAILASLGFEVVDESRDGLIVSVPSSKPDITMPADIAEEVMRIDGYDNIEIPSAITISPSVGAINAVHTRKEKTAGYLIGAGFNEIFTNSITNSAYFDEADVATGVKLINNLSAVHNMMRPSMLETGLEAVAYNLNRKNTDLRFYEFGKTYHSDRPGVYAEPEHLCLYVTGDTIGASWKNKPVTSDIFYLKGIVEAIAGIAGLQNWQWENGKNPKFGSSLALTHGGKAVAETGIVSKKELNRFDLRQDVFFADIRWDILQKIVASTKISFTALPNQLPVLRDLALVVDRSVSYQAVENAIRGTRSAKLKKIALFDVFESEKLGAGKKSFAISLTFLDEEKTPTDKEIDNMMNRIMKALEQDLNAEIRR